MEWIQNIDASVLLFIQEHIRNPALTVFFKTVSSLAQAGWFWLALAVILMIPKKTRRIGVTAFLSMAIGAITTNLCLKPLVARARPYDTYDTIIPLLELSDYSFPSGHTCASFASAFVYYRMLPKKYGVATMILAVLIMFSRLYLGVHYPTDVLGGLLVGLAASRLAFFIMKERYKSEYNRRRNKTV